MEKLTLEQEIKLLEKAIEKEKDFQSKWNLKEILRFKKHGNIKPSPYIPMMP